MKKVILIFLILYCMQNVSAQEQANVFSLKDDEALQEIKESKNYIVVSTGNDKTTYDNAYVFDTKGNIVFTPMEFERDVVTAFPIESYNTLLVILNSEGPLNNNLLRAYDLTTRTIKWEIELNAGSYEISPDEKYLMTNGVGYSESELYSPFTIINLNDGTKRNISVNFDKCYTNWLSTEKIVIIINQEEHTKEYKALLEKYQIIENKLEPIYQEREELSEKLKNKLITELDFKKRIDNNNYQYGKLIEEWRQLNNLKVNKYQYSVAKMMIYNLVTDKIEFEKEIYNSKGEGFYIEPLAGSDTHGKIFMDSNNDMYILGFVIINNSKPERSLIKLNQNGNIEWSKNIEKDLSYAIYPFSYRRDFYVKIIKGKEVYLIDKTNGRLEHVSNFKRDISFYNFLVTPGRQIFPPSIKYNLSNNRKNILFSETAEVVK